jgi:GxxExxY protein
MEPLVRAQDVLTIAQELHAELGPRLSPDAYAAALVYELEQRGAAVEQRCPLLLDAYGEELDMGYVADLLVDRAVVVRLETLYKLDPVNEAWLLERLALPGPRACLILDFGSSELDVLAVPSLAS